MTLLFSLISIDSAPRIGLGIAAVLTLAAGLVGMVRSQPTQSDSPTVGREGRSSPLYFRK